jgi:uracil-DNA glycosylase
MKCGYTGIAKDKRPCSLPIDHVAHGDKCEHGGDSPFPLIKGKDEYKAEVRGCRKCSWVIPDPRYGIGPMDPEKRVDIMLVGPYTEPTASLRLYGAIGYKYKSDLFGTDKWLDILCEGRTVFAVNASMCPSVGGGLPGVRSPNALTTRTCEDSWLMRTADFLRPRAIVCIGASPLFGHPTIKPKRTCAGILVKDIFGIQRVNVVGRLIYMPYPILLADSGWDMDLNKVVLNKLIERAGAEG